MIIKSESAQVSELADIEDSKRGSKIIIADHVIIDAFVKIKPAGGNGNLEIGKHSVLNSGCVLYLGNGVKIGAYCAIAANCTFAATNHEYRDRGKKIMDQGFMPSRGGIAIEDDVWIGASTVLLDGSVVGEGSIIGAGSVVNSTIPPYSIAIGNPARVIKTR